MEKVPFFIKKPLKLFVTFSAVVSYSLINEALAAGWEVEPSAKVSSIYSDNIDLEEDGESDLVMEVTPGVRVSREGRRLTVDLDYKLQNLVYLDNSDLNTNNHQLSADANSEILADTLFVDLGGSIRQQLTNRRTSGSSDGISGSANLSDVSSYSISPYWEQRLGDVADFELRYTYDNVKSNGSVGGDDSDSTGVSFDIENGLGTGRINWTISHDTREISYDDGSDNETERTDARIGYQLTRTFNAFISRTEEKNEFSGTRGNSEPEDSTSGVGFTWAPSQDFILTTLYNKRLDPRPDEDENFFSGNVFWAPTPRTNIDLGYGSRFFGKTYNASINHRARWTRWNISYNESVSNFRSQILEEALVCPASAVLASECRRLGPGETRQPGEVFFSSLSGGVTGIRLGISDDTFINETFKASVSIVGARNIVTLLVSDTKRRFIADNNIEEDSSIDLSWVYKLAPRTDSRITVARTQERFDDDQEDDFMRYAWRVTRRLTGDSTLFVEAQVNERDSDIFTRNYDENRLTVSFQKSF